MRPSLPRALIACLLLAGCTPEPPEKERPPEPKAAQAPATSAPATQGEVTPKDAIERARAVQDQLDQADQRQRDAVEDAGG